MNESIQQLKYIKEKLIHVSQTTDPSVANDVEILGHCISRIESQYTYLASCVKTEEEVRAIMQDCMKKEVSQMVLKETKAQTDAAYVLGIRALAQRLIEAFNANLNKGKELFPYDIIYETISECSESMIEVIHHG